MPTERRIEKMRDVLTRRQFDLQVVVDHVRDPHNASAIVRSSDGFGVQKINLLYEEGEFPEISEGVAAYAKKWVTLRRFEAAAALVQTLRSEGVRIYATNLDPDSVDYREVDWTQPSAVVFGNEHRGCSQEVIDLADASVLIPMQGMAQSFNVSVSAGIVLAEAFRQRSLAGLYAAAWDERHEAMLQQWIEREVRRERREG
jgi:tRNA (guanosine-2'-O-)-methyltransferase